MGENITLSFPIGLIREATECYIMLQKEKVNQAEVSQKMWLELIEKLFAKFKSTSQADILPKLEEFTASFTNSSMDFNQVLTGMFDKWSSILDPKSEKKDNDE